MASLSNMFSIDMAVVGVIALLLFGKHLPRVVDRVAAQFKRWL